MEENYASANLLQVSLLGVGTVLRLERDNAWSIGQATKEVSNTSAPAPAAPPRSPTTYSVVSRRNRTRIA